MKTKKIRIRQGFTIVELVIVIGVIGVLAAVLIPTFVNLNNKANKASDESLVKNLNTALAMQEQDPKDTKNATMQDAVEDLKEYGYLLPNLVTKSDEKLLWNQKTNRFVLEGENKNGYENLDFWRIQDTVKGDEIYSIYAGLNFKGNGADETIVNVTVGFDAGYNDALTAVNYTRTGAAQKAIIRTAGGALTINGKNDDVLHYGEATSVSVVDIASTSYHENGEVKFLEITAGHVVVEENASINAIHFNATNGEFKNEENKTISVDLSNANVEDISFSRDPVAIAENGTYVAEVTTDSTEYLWLFGEGIKEQMVVTTNEGPIAEGGTLKSGVSVGAEDGSVAEQIATPAKRNDAGELVDDNDQVIDLSTVDLTKSDALEGSEVVVEDVPSKETIIDGQTYFGGGTGSEIDPFIITDRETMENISNFYDKGYNFFRVKDGVNSIDCTGWTPVKLHGSFEGNNVKFTNVTACLFMSVGYQLAEENIVLSNFEATMNVSANGQYGAAALVKNIFNSGVTTFENVKVHGYLEGFWNMGSFFNYGTANYDDVGSDYEVVFNDCLSDATLVCASGNTIGGLFGHSFEGAGHSFTMRVNNTEYTGRMYLTTTSGKGNKYFGMTSDYNNALNHFYFDGVEDTFTNGSTKNAGAYENSVKIANVKAVKESGGYYAAKQSNVSKVVVTITAQLTAYDDQNVEIPNLRGITMTLSSEEITDLTGENVKVLELFNNVKISLNQSEYDAYINGGTLNIAIAGSTNYKSGTVRIQVNQYDSTGSIVSAGTTDVASCADATSQWVIK